MSIDSNLLPKKMKSYLSPQTDESYLEVVTTGMDKSPFHEEEITPVRVRRYTFSFNSGDSDDQPSPDDDCLEIRRPPVF